MNLDFIILAEKAEVLNGKLYMMGGGFERVNVSQLPGLIPVDLAIGIYVGFFESKEKHTLTLTLEDENNVVQIEPITVPFTSGRPIGQPAGDGMRFMLVVKGPFPISSEGLYHWVATINDVSYPPLNFRVHQLQSPQSTPQLPAK